LFGSDQFCFFDSDPFRPAIPISFEKWTIFPGISGRLISESLDDIFGIDGRFPPDYAASCKLVNLASEIVVHGDDDDYPVPRLGNIEIRDGDEIELGEYRIALKIPLTAEYLRKSGQIGAELSMPDAVVRPDITTVGHLTIKNIGMQPDCQFRVLLSGFPEDCYQIDPVPLMYPDAVEEVRVQLYHRKHYPSVGFHDLHFYISAPSNYPGEELIIKQGIYVVPVFDQTLTLTDDLAEPNPTFGVDTPIQDDPVPAAEKVERPSTPKLVIPEPPPTPIEVERPEDQDPEPSDRSEDSTSLEEAEPTPTLTSPKPASADAFPERPALDDVDQSAESTLITPAPVEVPEEADEIVDVETLDEPEAQVQEEPQPETPEPAPAPETAPVREETKPDQDRPKVKVVRKQFDEFWEEE